MVATKRGPLPRTYNLKKHDVFKATRAIVRMYNAGTITCRVLTWPVICTIAVPLYLKTTTLEYTMDRGFGKHNIRNG